MAANAANALSSALSSAANISMSSMSIPPSISNSIASVKSTSLGSVAGESHFLEETMNPGRVRQYLNAPKEMDKARQNQGEQ